MVETMNIKHGNTMGYTTAQKLEKLLLSGPIRNDIKQFVFSCGQILVVEQAATPATHKVFSPTCSVGEWVLGQFSCEDDHVKKAAYPQISTEQGTVRVVNLRHRLMQ